jgi:gluconate kinase
VCEVIAERIRDAADGRVVVLVDGGSGAGKTTLGVELARVLGVQLVSLDAFYPGWGGLEVGSAMVRANVLDAANPGWRRWDWAARAAAEWHPVDPDEGIVIEGSGSLSMENRELATYGIWIQLDQTERKRRAIARDGAVFAEHWDRWAAQEHAFFLRERPDLLADAVVDGGTGALIR